MITRLTILSLDQLHELKKKEKEKEKKKERKSIIVIAAVSTLLRSKQLAQLNDVIGLHTMKNIKDYFMAHALRSYDSKEVLSSARVLTSSATIFRSVSKPSNLRAIRIQLILGLVLFNHQLVNKLDSNLK